MNGVRIGINMKILILNEDEEKALTKMLSDAIIEGTCHDYWLATILEKINARVYENTFAKVK